MSVALHALARVESLGERVQRQQRETRALALDHSRALAGRLNEAAELAAEIAVGGSVYPVGVVDLARRIVGECEAHALNLQVIVGRSDR